MKRTIAALVFFSSLGITTPASASARSDIHHLHVFLQHRHQAHLRFLRERHAAHERFLESRHQAHLRFLRARHRAHLRALRRP